MLGRASVGYPRHELKVLPALAGLLACWLAGLLACWLAGLLAGCGSKALGPRGPKTNLIIGSRVPHGGPSGIYEKHGAQMAFVIVHEMFRHIHA